MEKLTILLCLFAASVVLGKPANNEALDKATANDVVINSVQPENKKTRLEEQPTTQKNGIYVSDVSFGTHLSTGSSNKQPGSAISRIIDDIFQIPIGVLQSVARLLQNPFLSHKKTPENTNAYK